MGPLLRAEEGRQRHETTPRERYGEIGDHVVDSARDGDPHHPRRTLQRCGKRRHPAREFAPAERHRAVAEGGRLRALGGMGGERREHHTHQQALARGDKISPAEESLNAQTRGSLA